MGISLHGRSVHGQAATLSTTAVHYSALNQYGVVTGGLDVWLLRQRRHCLHSLDRIPWQGWSGLDAARPWSTAQPRAMDGHALRQASCRIILPCPSCHTCRRCRWSARLRKEAVEGSGSRLHTRFCPRLFELRLVHRASL